MKTTAQKIGPINRQRARKFWRALNTQDDAHEVTLRRRIVLALVDIRHLCDRAGLDFGELDSEAMNDYREELAEARFFGAHSEEQSK